MCTLIIQVSDLPYRGLFTTIVQITFNSGNRPRIRTWTERVKTFSANQLHQSAIVPWMLVTRSNCPFTTCATLVNGSSHAADRIHFYLVRLMGFEPTSMVLETTAPPTELQANWIGAGWNFPPWLTYILNNFHCLKMFRSLLVNNGLVQSAENPMLLSGSKNL